MSHVALFVAGVGCGFITAAVFAASVATKRDQQSMRTHRAAMTALAKTATPMDKP